MGRLADKNILITGGNSGIGLAAAREFDREGARVAICGLKEGTLQAAKGRWEPEVSPFRADVSKLADLDTMFATIERSSGNLDGLFANAGYSEFLPFEEVTEHSFDKVIGSNFKGAYFTIQRPCRCSGEAHLSSSMRPLARARVAERPRPSRPARPPSFISRESSAPNSWTAGFA